MSRWGLGAAALGGKLYTVSGSADCHNGPPTASVEILESAGGAWAGGPSLRSARVDLAAAAWQGAIWALGGSDENLEPYASTERLDVAEGRWLQGPPLLQARYSLAAVATADSLFAIGGTPGKVLVEVLRDPDGTWEAAPPLSVGRYGHAAAACAGRIYVLGGPRLSSMEVLTEGGAWTEAPPMAAVRNGFAVGVLSAGDEEPKASA
eukprot:NODE_2996_length_846_cov_253.455120.p1 GENE.NODE_2996_length_846_cov_253.455120~~NODE_2996_length_846_cov_253.455120.p1  ORF type:complete len:239 (+),score=49.90 NODE_2996_length_846_cov_253.455120:97-717(+)